MCVSINRIADFSLVEKSRSPGFYLQQQRLSIPSSENVDANDRFVSQHRRHCHPDARGHLDDRGIGRGLRNVTATEGIVTYSRILSFGALDVVSLLLWLLVPYMRDALRRMPETTASQVIDFHQRPRLTAREAEVVRWLRKGKTNREIARILKVSDKTIKTHLQRLYDKLNVRNRMEAVWTLEFGLDESPRWARPLFDATPRVLS
ncbi:MAG: response regulator transcription factor [Sulfurifustaceae bacterium]